MGECNDYWCEHYGKVSGRCEGCEGKAIAKDNHELRVILKRRADRLMEIDKTPNKRMGQSR